MKEVDSSKQEKENTSEEVVKATQALFEGVASAASIPVPGHPPIIGKPPDIKAEGYDCDLCSVAMFLVTRKYHSNNRGALSFWQCRKCGHVLKEHRSLVR